MVLRLMRGLFELDLRGSRLQRHLLGELSLRGALLFEPVDARPDVRHDGDYAFERVTRDAAWLGRRAVACFRRRRGPWKETIVASVDRLVRKLPEDLLLPCFVRSDYAWHVRNLRTELVGPAAWLTGARRVPSSQSGRDRHAVTRRRSAPAPPMFSVSR
jgi:hypothetical protein